MMHVRADPHRARAPQSAHPSPLRFPHRLPAALYARTTKRELTADMAKDLKYYTPTMHKAAFQLPKFADKAFAGLRADSSAKAPCHTTTEYLLWGGALLLAAGLGAAGYAGAAKLLKK